MGRKSKKGKTEAEAFEEIKQMFPEGKEVLEFFNGGESEFCRMLRVGFAMLRGESVDLQS